MKGRKKQNQSKRSTRVIVEMIRTWSRQMVYCHGSPGMKKRNAIETLPGQFVFSLRILLLIATFHPVSPLRHLIFFVSSINREQCQSDPHILNKGEDHTLDILCFVIGLCDDLACSCSQVQELSRAQWKRDIND